TESQRPANTSTRLRLLQYRPLRRGRPAFACCNTVRFGAAGPPSLAAIPSASARQARLRLLQYRPLRRGRPAFACCNTVRFGAAGPPSLAAIPSASAWLARLRLLQYGRCQALSRRDECYRFDGEPRSGAVGRKRFPETNRVAFTNAARFREPFTAARLAGFAGQRRRIGSSVPLCLCGRFSSARSEPRTARYPG